MNDQDNLYHYCSLQTAIEHILPDKRLLVNPVGKSNDPRENKSYNFAFHSIPNPDNEEINPWRLNDEITREIRNGCKQTCFSKKIGRINGYELSRLWALYSDNHKGVCLEIDEAKFLEENSELLSQTSYFEAVEYDDLNDGPPLSLNIDLEQLNRLGIKDYIGKFRIENIRHLFFRKNKEWESENETKLLLVTNSQENEYCTIKKSLRKIIVGVDFNENYYPSLQINNENIQIKQVKYWNGRLNLGDI
jgi:hypothetical protein